MSEPFQPLVTRASRPPDEWGVMVTVFRRELMDVTSSVSELKDIRRAIPFFVTAAFVGLSVAGSGVLGLLGYWGTPKDQKPDTWLPVAYGLMVAIGLTLAGTLGVVNRFTKQPYDTDVDRLSKKLHEMCQLPSTDDSHQAAAEVGFRVIEARYGVGLIQEDVTDRLNGLIRSNRLDFIADNETLGGDPAPNKVKILIVRFVFNGEEFSISFDEGTHVSLP